MRIGMIAPPWLPVPPPAYGGTEAVLDGLVRGLLQAGHEVVLAAHPDSQTPAEIRSVLPRGTTDAIGQGATELAHVVAAYEQLDDVDVIHDHTLSGPLLGPARTDVPVVATHHGVFDDPTIRIFRAVARSAKVIAISHCQAAARGRHPDRRRRPPRDRRRRSPRSATGDGGYLAFLGRMVPEKGPHRAIQIARRLGMPLLLAAKMREAPEMAFFEAEVRHLLGGDIEYIGEVGHRDKVELLCGARALLNPIAWREPFGMVMLEALACGTPVVARAEGAAPEIVDARHRGLPRPDRRRARGWGSTTSTASTA